MKESGEGGCQSQFQTGLGPEFAINVLAWCVVIGAYPYIVYKRKFRGPKNGAVAPLDPAVGSKVEAQNSAPRPNESVDDGSTGNNVLDTEARWFKKLNRRSTAFTVLTLMTCSTFFFWTPAVATYVTNAFNPLPYPALFQTVLIIFTLQPVLDPILFTVAIKDLQTAFRRVFGI